MDSSAREVQNYLDGTDADAEKAKMGISVMNVFTKREATRVHLEALKLKMVQMIYHNNPEQLAQAVAILGPDLKKLPAA